VAPYAEDKDAANKMKPNTPAIKAGAFRDECFMQTHTLLIHASSLGRTFSSMW
jgi:hypothetical protein